MNRVLAMLRFKGVLSRVEVPCAAFPRYAETQGWKDLWGTHVRGLCRDGQRELSLAGPDGAHGTGDDLTVDERLMAHVHKCDGVPTSTAIVDCDKGDPLCGM
ncbi:MAG: hypothetical protein HOV80_28530 [Polyangiaceae bacterium]|nr:hypothetical protein [Polyangiaceae bacterium]